MDPLGTVQALVGAIKYFYDASEKAKENRQECKKLCAHANSVLDIIRDESKGSIPPKLVDRLSRLSNTLLDIAVTIEELSKRSLLQRLIWRSEISGRIQECYKELSTTMREFKIAMVLDMNRMQRESEEARKQDSSETEQNFERVFRNDQEILAQLEIRHQQMQEAILCIQRDLPKVHGAGERRFLESGMHAMQRRSGPMKAIPDEFVITSLDVIIRHNIKLGEGGFAAVYEGDWKGTRVAVKVLERGVPASAIQQEVNVWKRLRHPHILEFFGACSVSDPPFMVCAFKENGDALEYLRGHPEASRCWLLSDAALGLEYLHQRDVIHGDLKATNILVNRDGRACIADFGLSRIKSQTTMVRVKPQTDLSVGTARWMSPEHTMFGQTNKKTDIYSFAMTMYEIFTGHPPFANTPDSMLFIIVCDRSIRPPRPTTPEIEAFGLTDAVWAIITQAWTQEPAERQPASEIASSLTEIAKSQTTKTDKIDGPNDDTFGMDLDQSTERTSDSAQSYEDESFRALLANLQELGVDEDVLEREKDFVKDFVRKAQQPRPQVENGTPDKADTPELPTFSPSGLSLEPRLVNSAVVSELLPFGPSSLRLEDLEDTNIPMTYTQSLPQATTTEGRTTSSVPTSKYMLDIASQNELSGRRPRDPSPSRRRPTTSFRSLKNAFQRPASPSPVVEQTSSTVEESVPPTQGSNLPAQTMDASKKVPDTLTANFARRHLLPKPSTEEVIAANQTPDEASLNPAVPWYALGYKHEQQEDTVLADMLAVRMYQCGVDVGDPRCTYRMGMAYLFGQLSLPKSPTRAIELLGEAAKHASAAFPQPAYLWGLVLLDQFPTFINSRLFIGNKERHEGFDHLEGAASLNYGRALFQIGWFYEFSAPMYSRNPMKSMQYYKKAAQCGVVEAHIGLSRWFLKGKSGPGGFAPDLEKARRCAAKAAKQDLAMSQYVLGYYHEIGVGGPVDLKAAQTFYQLAADRGSEDAKDRLVVLTERLANSTVNQPTADVVLPTSTTKNGFIPQSRSQVVLERPPVPFLVNGANHSLGPSRPSLTETAEEIEQRVERPLWNL